MSYITLKCKNCGANMSLNTESHSATCNHCGSTFLIAELLDEKDAKFIKKFSPENIEDKIMAQEALHQGETYLIQAQYEKAETSFKRAIELDENNYRCYLGVVKAKTNNLNVIPENEDYLQYASYALDLAKGDDHIFVKNELAKLKLLKREKARQKKENEEKELENEKQRLKKQGMLKITSSLVVFVSILFVGFIFLGSKFFLNIFSKNSTKTINIDSYSEFQSVFSSEKYLNYNINLDCDIDFENNELTPLGSFDKPFTGTFNGNKHKISNAVIKTSSNGEFIDCIGLFGFTKLASISNLILDNVSISTKLDTRINSSPNIGLLAGKVNATTIKNIEVKNTSSIEINFNLDHSLQLGGLVGTAENSSHVSFVSCHPQISVNTSQTTLETNSYIGCIIGLASNSIVEKTCSNSSLVATLKNSTKKLANAYLGGTIGYIQNATSQDLLNTRQNTFTGTIKANPTDLICKLSAIAGSGIKSHFKQNNNCYIEKGSFILSGTKLTKTSLYDYDSSDNFVSFYSSSDNIYQNLNSTFSTWEIEDTFEPNLI